MTAGQNRLRHVLFSHPATLIYGLLLGVTDIGGVAIAQGGDDNTLFGCAHKQSGDLRIVDADEDCQAPLRVDSSSPFFDGSRWAWIVETA